MAKRTVVIEVKERNPWGETLNDAVVNDPGRTSTYVEGYSNTRSTNEMEAAKGRNTTPLKRRLQWVRVERPNGDADGRRVAHWRKKGYTVPKWDEAIAEGYGIDVGAGQKGTDGSIRLGDTMLMWATADVAAAHYQAIRQATREASDAYQVSMEAATEQANRSMGYRPGARGATSPVFEIEHEADPKKPAKK